MGYCIDQESCMNFLIKKEKFAGALEAIKALAGKGDVATRYNGVNVPHYSWVSRSFADAETLEDALDDWRWSIHLDEKTGDAVNLSFNGEKLGSDTILFNAIAPFVESGEIEMSGEDGSRWKWVFKDGKFKELSGRVVYDE